MKNNQNPPEYFPEFNEYHLRYYAKEWIKHHKNTPAIESIILYRCYAVYQNLFYEESLNDPDWPMKAPTKYALVFNIVVPPIFKQTKEHYGLKSENYSNCEICKIMDIENYRKFLIDIGYNDDPRWDTPLKVFLDSTFQEIVYRRPPKHNFRDDWKLQAKHPNEEFYRHIVVDGPKWILYDNTKFKIDKDEKNILKQNIPSADIQDDTPEEGLKDFPDEIIDLMNEARQEIELIYKAIKEGEGFREVSQEAGNRRMEDALYYFEEYMDLFKTISKEDLINRKIYDTSYDQYARRVKGMLLQAIIKRYNYGFYAYGKLFEKYQKQKKGNNL